MGSLASLPEELADRDAERAKAAITSAGDVRRLIALEPLADGGWRYFLETTFATFPKFVIGRTNKELTGFHYDCRCSVEWNAREHWEARNRQ